MESKHCYQTVNVSGHYLHDHGHVLYPSVKKEACIIEHYSIYIPNTT